MGQNDDIVPGFDEKYDESLDISLERVEGVENGILLRLAGYIDTYNTNVFQKRIASAINSGFIRLMFDCTRLNYLSSTGIGSFTIFLKSVRPHKGDVVLYGLQPRILEIFQLLGFSQFFNIVQSQEEARQHFVVGNAKVDQSPESSDSFFPSVIQCVVCGKKLRALKPGRFRCSQCKSIITIDEEAQVTAG